MLDRGVEVDVVRDLERHVQLDVAEAEVGRVIDRGDLRPQLRAGRHQRVEARVGEHGGADGGEVEHALAVAGADPRRAAGR